MVLGLDPGLARVGYAVVRIQHQVPRLVTFDTLTTPAHTPHSARLLAIAHGLRVIIRRTHPTRVAIERLFFQTNTSTAMAVSEARGVLQLVCAEAGLPIVEFTPNEIKRTVAGSGSANKRGVEKMVRLILKLPPTPHDDDATDAVAIALCAAMHYGPLYGSHP